MGFFDFVNGVFETLSEFAESETGQKLMQKAQEAQYENEQREAAANEKAKKAGLKIKIDSLTQYGSIYIVKGSVVNVGDFVYDNVSVNLVFRDANGNICDKQTIYVVIGESLDYGEAKAFSTSSTAVDVERVQGYVCEYSTI